MEYKYIDFINFKIEDSSENIAKIRKNIIFKLTDVRDSIDSLLANIEKTSSFSIQRVCGNASDRLHDTVVLAGRIESLEDTIHILEIARNRETQKGETT